ncbi:hypothetical protein [Desulfoluna spongiiphila]|uniref:UDP-N-acetyl-D-galactosamine dehydrogenase n=1 Tax=Desulfoluna spongiiphila TaxID=419481 RepID=A0A1G5IC72_9BACT|nr:UDP-N-acetyl-D-galactosamine dehydrogenase [Desulfoluna spongiiphila]
MIVKADVIIVAVPTPINKTHQPDLTLISSSETMKEGAVVIYDSTGFPRVTENIRIPILEKDSRKKWR